MQVTGYVWNMENITRETCTPCSSFEARVELFSSQLNELEIYLEKHDLSTSQLKWNQVFQDFHQLSATLVALGFESPSVQGYETQRAALSLYKEKLSLLTLKLQLQLINLSKQEFLQLTGNETFKDIKDCIDYQRRSYIGSKSYDKEQIVASLTYEGLYPLEDQYRKIRKRLAVLDQEVGSIDVENASLLFEKGPLALRERVFKNYEKSINAQVSLFETLINQIYGFRHAVIKEYGPHTLLDYSLSRQALSKSALEVMWRVASDRRGPQLLFLNKKAALLGHKKAQWIDIKGELISPNQELLEFKEAYEWIAASFSRLRSSEGEWVRGLLRGGAVMTKVPYHENVGSFALSFPLSKAVCIYSSYQNDITEIGPLARSVMKAWQAKTLFETSAQFFETPPIVSEALTSFFERVLLDLVRNRAHSRQMLFKAFYNYLQKALLQVVDNHVLFLFEQKLVAERIKGLVTSTKLSFIMHECQKIAYAEQLLNYFPGYWASQSSLYNTKEVFSNYPQACGFLLGLSLYQLYKKHPQGFLDKLEKWLLSVSCLGIESSAQATLDLSLSHEKPWEGAMSQLESDTRVFIELIQLKDL